MKSRFFIFYLVICLFWVGLVTRAVYLQIVPNQKLAEVKKRQFEKLITIKSRRGGIYDRNGVGLALSVPSYSVYADPSFIISPVKVSQQISKVLKKNWKDLYKKIKNKSN